MADQVIAIAVVKRPFGIHGFCNLELFGSTLESITLPHSFYIGKDQNSIVPIEIDSGEIRAQGAVVHFVGYDSIESLEQFRDSFLFINEKDLPSLPEGHIYDWELTNLTVEIATTGEKIGVVQSVQHYPSMDALEVRKQDGFSFFLPFNYDIILKIDMQEKKIIVRQDLISDLL